MDFPAGNAAIIPNLTDVNGTLYFTVLDVANNVSWQLWKSNGAEDGTVRVTDISYLSLYALTNYDGTLYFVGEDGIHGRELWKSDGTADGTVRVTDMSRALTHHCLTT